MWAGRLLFPLIMGALVVTSADVASANDTSLTLGMGGLEVARNDAIEMQSEDLLISMERVRVKYVFKNRTDKDVTILVGFPLPDLKSVDQETPISLPAPSADNFVEFETKIDGTVVPLMVEHKAMFNGKDRTAELRAAGAPLNPFVSDFAARVEKMKPEARAGLIADGLIVEDVYDAGAGKQVYWRPMWDLSTKFYREQTFPANKAVVVEHSYRPVLGGTVAPVLNYPDRSAETVAQYKKDFCVQPNFRKGMRRFGVDGATEAWLTYILVTGANWAGPIKSFKLTVDKGRPENLVSFCADGVKKISPTQFEMSARNFVPTADLNVLFVLPHPQ